MCNKNLLEHGEQNSGEQNDMSVATTKFLKTCGSDKS